MVLRHVNKEWCAEEHFIGFFRVIHTDGETLYDLVHSVMGELDLDVQDMVAQCYDGAANMSGEYKGVAAQLRADNTKAFYIHCNAHVLNLELIDAAKTVVTARNTLGTVGQLHNFICASAKRHAVFEAVQESAG